ncbi:MAG: TetR/AcrR family transcriptional regulator [Chloroflexota bacterium]
MIEQPETRQLILRAAEELFMRYGYASVSMRRLVEEITRHRKLTKPAIYYYYSGKEGLYVAVLLDVAARQGRQLRAASGAAAELRARLVGLAEVLARLDPESLTRMRLDIEQHLGAEARTVLRQAFQREILGPVLDVFEQASQEGRLRPNVSSALAAAAFLGLVGSLAARARYETGANTAEVVADLLLRGVARP